MLELFINCFLVAAGLIFAWHVIALALRLWPLALLALIAWACVGCGSDASRQAPGFRTIDGSPSQVEWANDTLDVFRNLVPVDVDRVEVGFVDTWEEQRDACHGFAACTWPLRNGYHIATYWPEQWDESHPQLLAHELCHVHYFQTGEQGDPTHSHIECFDRRTGFAAETAMIVAKNYGGQS